MAAAEDRNENRDDVAGDVEGAVAGAVSGEVVVPARAFPLSAPEEGIGLIGADGHELAWVERLDALPPESRRLLREALAARDFTPEIQRIVRVSGFITPCTWTVATDRGETDFLLRSEESIRRLSANDLLIVDGRGVHYRIRDLTALDAQSRKWLDRFL